MSEASRVTALSIPSDPAGFPDARRWIELAARAEGLDPSDVRRVVLAASEALANAHRHAYRGRDDGRIDLEVEAEGGAVRVAIRDYGATFDPGTYRPPDLAAPSENGYGIHLMTSLVDYVTFERPGIGTRVVLVKSRPSPGELPR